jgi:hypothetical protein
MAETTVGNFNIKIYPNPTKGQLALNIVNLGKDDKNPSEGFKSFGRVNNLHFYKFLYSITNFDEIHAGI